MGYDRKKGDESPSGCYWHYRPGFTRFYLHTEGGESSKTLGRIGAWWGTKETTTVPVALCGTPALPSHLVTPKQLRPHRFWRVIPTVAWNRQLWLNTFYDNQCVTPQELRRPIVSESSSMTVTSAGSMEPLTVTFLRPKPIGCFRLDSRPDLARFGGRAERLTIGGVLVVEYSDDGKRWTPAPALISGLMPESEAVPFPSSSPPATPAPPVPTFAPTAPTARPTTASPTAAPSTRSPTAVPTTTAPTAAPTPPPATPPPTHAPTVPEFDPTSPLTSYMDRGACGPRGNDAEADTFSCVAGAIPVHIVPNDRYQIVARVNGCDYFAYTIYTCIGPEPTPAPPVPTFAPTAPTARPTTASPTAAPSTRSPTAVPTTTAPTAAPTPPPATPPPTHAPTVPEFDPTSPLTSYMDRGACGPRGNDAEADTFS